MRKTTTSWPRVPQVPRTFFELLERREQIGDQHDEPALVDAASAICSSGAARSVAVPAGLTARARASIDANGPGGSAAAGSRAIVSSNVSNAHRVALQRQKIRERRGERAGVLGLGVAERAVAHRAAEIDQQMAAQVRLVLEPLDVVAVGAGVQPPVEIPRIVARACTAGTR